MNGSVLSRLGDDLHGAAAGLAGFDVDVEHALESLCPSHGDVPL